MELRHLQHFVAVAEDQHFTRAAERLLVSQSGLSASIRALERELQTPLFVRTTRRVARTPAGRALLGEAERIAAVIASRGPIAVRFAKEALRHGADLTLPQALRYETDLTVILQTTADRAEGVAAFVEKRQPRFEGR